MSGLVAFLGLGVMGAPMAAAIARAGLPVEAHDVLPAARDRAASDGLTVTGDVADLLRRADVVLTMLPNTEHVAGVVHGPDGTLAHCRSGTVHVDMSSISPVTTRELAAASLAAGLGYVDAPVSGGVAGARAGTLSVMAGGAAEHLDAVAGVLAAMSSRVTRMGPVGAGQATKVCNQVAVAVHIQAVCEAFTLGSALGLDLRLLREALLGGSSASWVLEHLGPQMIDGDDAAGFRIALQVKDLRLGLEAAQVNGIPLPAASGVLDMYLAAVAHGDSGHGNQALSRVYERFANVRIADSEGTQG